MWWLRLGRVLLFVAIILSLSANWRQPVRAGEKITPELKVQLQELAPGEKVAVILTFHGQVYDPVLGFGDRARRQQRLINNLKIQASRSQQGVVALLEQRQLQGLATEPVELWIINGLAVSLAPEVIDELALRPEVLQIRPDRVIPGPSLDSVAALPERNIETINAPALWDLGYTGQGVVVAALDTGVSLSHPEVVDRWRGGSNSWYDPYGEHPNEPADHNGHGTAVVGVMVGGDAGGTSIGVAPGARWIAAKVFNDNNEATTSAIHMAFQWVLDPDDDSETADAPQVVNSSWTYIAPGCDLEFQPDLHALAQAGILPVFAAGNYGPSQNTSTFPANNPDGFAVGATYDDDVIYEGSSRGPSDCGEPETIYPELVAPGVRIRSTIGEDDYIDSWTGTSMAAPHVAGALALLFSAAPDISLSEQKAALMFTAIDLGETGPDNVFGYGRLDVLAAYHWLEANHLLPTPSQTITDTPTLTPMPEQIQHVLPLIFQDGIYATPDP